MTKNIEAEGGELILRNKNGSVAIIPAKYRQEALDMIKDGCTNCLNDMISKLPRMKDYAKDGTVVPDKIPTELESVTIRGKKYPADSLGRYIAKLNKVTGNKVKDRISLPNINGDYTITGLNK